jgi:hypothetical protein
MMRRIFILMFLVALAGGIAQAILPPDAKAREPQLRTYYQKVRNNYEERQVERKVEVARANERTQVEIFTPPWMRGTAQTALQSDVGSATSATGKTGKRNHRFLVSVVLLILLGAVAGWIRHATREIDE